MKSIPVINELNLGVKASAWIELCDKFNCRGLVEEGKLSIPQMDLVWSIVHFALTRTVYEKQTL